jgi:hypothetical protein
VEPKVESGLVTGVSVDVQMPNPVMDGAILSDCLFEMRVGVPHVDSWFSVAGGKFYLDHF